MGSIAVKIDQKCNGSNRVHLFLTGKSPGWNIRSLGGSANKCLKTGKYQEGPGASLKELLQDEFGKCRLSKE